MTMPCSNSLQRADHCSRLSHLSQLRSSGSASGAGKQASGIAAGCSTGACCGSWPSGVVRQLWHMRMRVRVWESATCRSLTVRYSLFVQGSIGPAVQGSKGHLAVCLSPSSLAELLRADADAHIVPPWHVVCSRAMPGHRLLGAGGDSHF